jgi:tetratricopeptide (TPR) repeat protein
MIFTIQLRTYLRAIFMNRFLYIIVLLIFTSFVCPHAIFAFSAGEHIERGKKYLANDRPFAAVEEFRQAIEKGADAPILFRNLSIVFYNLGFLDEAISYMQKALSLSPYANYFQMELGIIYLAQDNNEKAREQFMAILGRNPGFSNAYYYIGETFYRTKEYDMAWMFAGTAKKLRHKGSRLTAKLEKVSTPPDIEPWNVGSDELLVRQILVDTKLRAEEIVKRIAEEELFEDMATEIDETLNSAGGFLGHFKRSELHPKILKALSAQEVFSDPAIVETELGFHIVQRIASFNFKKWDQMLADYKKTREHEINIARASEQKKAEGTFDALTESRISKKAAFVNSKPASPVVVNKTKNTVSREKHKRKHYLVYSGAFSKETYAVQRNEKLRSLGLPSYIRQKHGKKGLVYTVIAGKFDSLQKAREAGKDIASHGLEYFISK